MELFAATSAGSPVLPRNSRSVPLMHMWKARFTNPPITPTPPASTRWNASSLNRTFSRMRNARCQCFLLSARAFAINCSNFFNPACTPPLSPFPAHFTSGDFKPPKSSTVPPLPIAYSHPEIHNRSEEHTSELQSPDHLVCRLLLEKKNKTDSILQTNLHH